MVSGMDIRGGETGGPVEFEQHHDDSDSFAKQRVYPTVHAPLQTGQRRSDLRNHDFLPRFRLCKKNQTVGLVSSLPYAFKYRTRALETYTVSDRAPDTVGKK